MKKRQKLLERVKKKKEECHICYCEVEISNMIKLYCGHRFCISCLKEHFENQLNSKSIKLICPQAGCGKKIKLDFLIRIGIITDTELIDKHLHKYLDLCIKNDKRNKVRYCPNCGEICFRDKKQNKKVCKKCKKEFCFYCLEDSHIGTCEDYKKWKEENSKGDELFEEYLKKNKFVRCPNCGIAVEKNGGCDHIKCRKDQGGCDADFCYSCGKLMTPGNHECVK